MWFPHSNILPKTLGLVAYTVTVSDPVLDQINNRFNSVKLYHFFSDFDAESKPSETKRRNGTNANKQKTYEIL